MNSSKSKIILLILFLISFFSYNLFANSKEWFKKGETAFKSKDYKSAIDYFSKSLDKNKPKLSEKLTYYYRAMSYLYLQDVDKAIIDLTTIIKLDSSFSDAYNSRGLCYGYLGNIDNAINDFKKAVNLDSSFSQAYINLGSAYMAQKENDSAEKMFDKVVELNPDNPENYFLRASLLYELGDYKKSIEDFTHSINHGLKIVKNYYNRANAYYKLKKYLRAINDYSKVLELDSNNINALNNRAASYLNLGLKRKAEEDRLRIAIISAGIDKTPDVETIKFKKYNFLKGKISISLPANWFAISDTTKYGVIKVIAKDTIRNISTNYLVGVKMSLDSNMSEQFNLKKRNDILKFWDKSTQVNTKSYFQYTNVHEEKYKINDFSGIFKTVRVMVSRESFPIRYYELVLVKDDVLFYVFMQSPEIQFAYYKQIFDKARKSIKINY